MAETPALPLKKGHEGGMRGQAAREGRTGACLKPGPAAWREAPGPEVFQTMDFICQRRAELNITIP
jgi:hypothetical protein